MKLQTVAFLTEYHNSFYYVMYKIIVDNIQFDIDDYDNALLIYKRYETYNNIN